MFDILDIPHEVVEEEINEQPVKVYVFYAEDLYPAVIGRIRDVLAGANPSELLATTERGGSARADVLLKNARALPTEAWDDALRPREQFIAEVPYFSVVSKNGRENQEFISLLPKAKQADVLQMVHRGFALEIALGWFSHALRLAIGGNINRIRSREGSKPFRL